MAQQLKMLKSPPYHRMLMNVGLTVSDGDVPVDYDMIFPLLDFLMRFVQIHYFHRTNFVHVPDSVVEQSQEFVTVLHIVHIEKVKLSLHF